MKLTIEVEDELAKENVGRMWKNRINVTNVINELLASLKFEINYNFESITIQKTVTDCHQLKSVTSCHELVTN